jgi:hypothetical protein
VLQYRASGTDKFYLITTASQTVFQLDRNVAVEVARRAIIFRKSGTRKSPAATAGLFDYREPRRAYSAKKGDQNRRTRF